MDNFLTYKSYIGTVNYNADDEVFYGKIQGINDLITFEAENAKNLKIEFHNAVDDYLETCAELNKEPNKTFKGSFNIRLTTMLHKKASLIASKNRITLNEFVRKAISYAVNNESDLENISTK